MYGPVENFKVGIFSDTINVRQMWYFTFSFTCSFHCPWPWHFKITALSNSFNWKFYILIRLSLNIVALLSTSSRHECTTFFFFFFSFCKLSHIFRGDKICIVGVLKDAVQASFFLLFFFQNLHYYNFAWGLPNYTRFDYLDLVSRSKVCQNHKLQLKKKKKKILVHLNYSINTVRL